MGLELTVMAVVGLLVGIPVIGIILNDALKPKPCEGLTIVLNKIISNQEKITERIVDTQNEILESQRLILHYLDLMERHRKPD